MPRPRTEFELSIERELPGGDPAHPTRVRLSARFAAAPGEGAVPPEEIRATLEGLRAELDSAIGPSAGPAPRRRTGSGSSRNWSRRTAPASASSSSCCMRRGSSPRASTRSWASTSPP